MAGIEIGGRNFDRVVGFAGEPAIFSGMVFGFLDDGIEESSECSWSSGEVVTADNGVDDNDGEEENPAGIEEKKAFWENQESLLQTTLYRTSSLESTIRQITKEALNELKAVADDTSCCVCRKPAAGDCRNCLRGEISNRLRNAGYNCFICNSKWKSSPEIPAGEHTYLEVLDKSNSKKGEIRVVIELNFRGEFEMARASEEYNRLISRLPEVFVGKSERLRSLIKILCSATKKCMKDKKMHMGPWRKHKYMQAKWFGTCERTTVVLPLLVGISDRLPKPRASMLTFDLLENMPILHCTAVEVL